jgi:hypothetical protein
VLTGMVISFTSGVIIMYALSNEQIEELAEQDIHLAVRYFKNYMVKNHLVFMSYYYPNLVVEKNIDYMLRNRQSYMSRYFPREMFNFNPSLMVEINLPWVMSNKRDWVEKNRPDLLSGVVTKETIDSYLKAIYNLNN